ncbi:hypothetical protein V8J82_00800 [Gymnodinialimonas sp. 2305UL16-5]|uniref:hypothetical protein n=1 Tax=Gymnodinialimonas mytili TaxID=3126503 RepID=UPI0030AA7746
MSLVLLVISVLVGGVILRYVTKMVMGSEATWLSSFIAAGIGVLLSQFAVPVLLLAVTDADSAIGLMILIVAVLSTAIMTVVVRFIIRTEQSGEAPGWGGSLGIAVLHRIAIVFVNMISSAVL